MAFPLLPMRPPTPSRDIGKLPMPIDDHKEDRQFVTALARGLQVLKCFTSGEEHLGNQEIAQRCRLPKSTVTRLTHTLTLLDFLHHDSVQNRYRLGMATLSLGGTTLLRLDAREISRPIMQELANQTGCLIALGMREGMSMLYLETARSDASVITIRLNLGSRIPLHTTAMGRAYLAGSRPAARRSVMERVKKPQPRGLYRDRTRHHPRRGRVRSHRLLHLVLGMAGRGRCHRHPAARGQGHAHDGAQRLGRHPQHDAAICRADRAPAAAAQRLGHRAAFPAGQLTN